MQQSQVGTLPKPDAISAAHSALVARHVRELIASKGGSVSFAEFMHEVLYAPGLGYYSAGATKFGTEGDFVTAPELASVFGRVLARQCAGVISTTKSPSILEFGAGSGKLAADLLTQLAELDALPDCYKILEVSAELCERQQAFLADAIPDFVDRVSWLDQLPEAHEGVIIANEVLDALPVERFVRRARHVAQHCVVIDEGKFAIAERNAHDTLTAAVVGIEQDLGQRLPEGYVSEVCLAAPAWIADVAGILRNGIAFLFDYGVSRREYYAPDRSDGWLRCHFRHHAHNDPLRLPGIQDITAWVDFSAVADAATAHGLDIAGYVTQAHFLLNGGLADELAEFSDLPLAAQLKLSGQVKLLTLPGEMGESFKCLGISRKLASTPASLTLSDRAISL